MWIQPIFDRTQADVDLIRLDPTNSNAKGSYNYSDLNRIESDCEYIKEIAEELYQTEVTIQTKTNWTMSDIPTKNDFDRIIGNLEILKDVFYAIQTETVTVTKTLNYMQANAIEKILFDIDAYIKSITKYIELNCNVGCKLIYTKYIDLKVYSEEE